jgi:hypothetical protein
MSAHHIKLNLDKTELLFITEKACPLKDLSIMVDNSTLSPSQSVKNLGVTLDNTLSFSANIKAVTPADSCCTTSVEYDPPHTGSGTGPNTGSSSPLWTPADSCCTTSVEYDPPSHRKWRRS